MNTSGQYWAQRALQTLAPLSKKKYPFTKVLSEWYYNGNMIDLDEPEEVCELCGKDGLKYQFGISNSQTKHELYVGSECIKKFDLSGIDESGNFIDHHQTKIKVQKDRSNLIKESKRKRVLHALMLLDKEDEEVDLEDTIEKFEEKGKFSPNQLAFLFWRLTENEITFRPSDFEISIRRARNKKQLRDMEEWKYNKIKPALTTSQQEYRESAY